MTIKGIKKTEFRKRLVAACSGCVVQHTGWPCATCFAGTPDEWRAVLAYRGDYEKYRTKIGYRLATDIVFKDDGTFSHHVFAEIPKAEITRRIQQLWHRLSEPYLTSHMSVR